MDRLIQQVVAQVLSPLFEVDFSEHSHGFRPGRYAHQAVAQMESGWKEGRRHAVDCDLKSFFDTVNHDQLMSKLREKIHCPRTLGLIRRYLTAGVELPDGTRETTPLGVPQGGPLSPLLANIVLDPLDKELESRGHVFARYADDFIILVKSAKAAQRVMGIFPERVHMASRSRKGYWRMSGNTIVQTALNNRWLEQQGVPNMRAMWIALHYPEQRNVPGV